nr:hypothetical protein [uncultured Flavobacterium sp.]
MENKASTNHENGNDANRLLAVRACEGSCEEHKGEVVPVIIEGHGWNGTKFNYCQAAIEEDERRGFVVRHDR